MNDFDRRRVFVALTLIPSLPIGVGGETVESLDTYSRDRVTYRGPDDHAHECRARDVSFDFAVLTGEQRAKIELYEQERELTFASALRKKLRTYTFDTFTESEGNRHALARCKALELGQNLFIHGPPGNGKTMLATATARDASRYYSAAV